MRTARARHCTATFAGSYYSLASAWLPSDASTLAKWSVAFACHGAALLVSHPLDTVRRHLMVAVGHEGEQVWARGLSCARAGLAREGVRFFYRGVGPALGKGSVGALLLANADRWTEYVWQFRVK